MLCNPGIPRIRIQQEETDDLNSRASFTWFDRRMFDSSVCNMEKEEKISHHETRLFGKLMIRIIPIRVVRKIQSYCLLAHLQLSKLGNSFSINNKLGQGGFGPVYKGVLEDGRKIAVKRLSKTSTQGLGEFMNEVECIAKLQHRNLVKLLGYYIQGDERMLIYEYMANKSLDLFINDKPGSSMLNWPFRFHIIHGIAQGILYLHQDSRLRIIHRDLKAGNILLDNDMNPKISDFGLARMFSEHKTEANTNKVVGTCG